MSPFFPATLIPNPDLTPEKIAALTGGSVEQARLSMALVMKEDAESRCFKNDAYQVMVRVLPEGEHGMPCLVVHLSIKRLDREPIHDWRDLQAIKNELVGERFDAVELYPAEDRLVDTANQYHLWVFASKWRLPLGWKTRMVTSEQMPGAKQRPYPPGGA